MADVQLLTTTIAGIVSAPCPVSLTNFGQILDRTSEQQLDAWCEIKHCQVEPLVANLTNRLDNDVEALSCLVQLIQSKHFRVALTANAPVMMVRLFQDLEQSIPPRKVLRICSAILSVGLESALPIPKCLVDSIDRLFAEPDTFQAEDSSADCTLAESILTFIASSPIVLLFQLQDTTIAGLTNLWKNLLRSEAHHFAIKAVFVAHRLVKHHATLCCASISNKVIATPEHLQAWIDKATSLFSGTKATSVLDTMMLVVLKVCSQTQNGNHNMLATIEMCQEVICDLDPSLLNVWSCNNPSVISKLRTKHLQHKDVKLQPFTSRILGVLCPDLALAAADLPLIEPTAGTSSVDIRRKRSTVPDTIERLVLAADMNIPSHPTSDQQRTSLTQLINWAVQWCSPGLNVIEHTYYATELAIDLVENLLKQTGSRPGVAGLVTDMLLQAGIAPESWRLDLSSPGSPQNCAALPVCLHKLEQRRQHLCTCVSFLLLQTASTSDRTLCQDVICRLRKQLSSSKACNTNHCCRYPRSSHSLPAILEAAEEVQLTGDWRADLDEYMLNFNNRTRDKIESTVLNVCRDLQHRCDNIELPLQKARQEATELKNKLEDVVRRLESSRAYAIQQTNLLEKEREDKDTEFARAQRLEVELGDVSQELLNCQRQVVDAKQDAEQSRQIYERSLAEQKAVAEQNNLDLHQEHARVQIEFEETLRLKTQAESNLKSENAWLKEELIRTTEELTSGHLAAMADVEKRHQFDCSSLQEQLQVLEGQSSAQAANLREVKNSLVKANDANQNLSRELQAAQSHITGKMGMLEDRDSAIDSLRNSLQREQGATAQLRRQQEAGELERTKLETQVRELQDSKAVLQKQCRTQTKALENAKKAEQRVLAILGHNRPMSSSAATTATATPSQNQRASAQVLPEFSLVSEDDEDYADVMKRT